MKDMKMDFGYGDYLQAQRIIEMANRLGFKTVTSKYSDRWGDRVALVPLNEALPVYSRDAELFSGTFNEVECWLRGVEWTKTYHEILGAAKPKQVARKEQDYRNRVLMHLLTKEKDEETKK